MKHLKSTSKDWYSTNLVFGQDVKKTLQSFIMEEVAVRRDCGAVPLASSLSYTLDPNLFPTGL